MINVNYGKINLMIQLKYEKYKRNNLLRSKFSKKLKKQLDNKINKEIKKFHII